MLKKYRLLLIIVIAIVAAAAVAALLYFGVYKPLRAQKARRMQQEYYNSKLETYCQENQRYSPGQVDVVFLGDSLTDGYDLDRYYSEYTVLNRGISGDTTFGLEDRLQVSVYDVQPKVAVMLIGANNFGTMMDNYEKILQGFRENLPDTKVVLLSLTSMAGNWGHNNQIAAYNNVQIKLLSEKYGYHYVDLYAPLLDLQTGEMNLAYTTDGGHFSEKGYDVVTQQIKPVISELLQ